METNPRYTLLQSIKYCLLDSSFSGRSRRSEFWWFMLSSTIIQAAISYLIVYLTQQSSTNIKTIFHIGMVIITFIIAYCQTAVTSRRLHDVGKSGWWSIIVAYSSIGGVVTSFFPHNTFFVLLSFSFLILYLVVVFGFCSADSMKQTNQYGISPKYDPKYDRESEIEKKEYLNIFAASVGCTGCLLKIFVTLGVMFLLAHLLCHIDPNITYVWYHGIWHGLFILPNFVLSLWGETLYKAETYTTAYNVWWWITIIWLALGLLKGRG